ncbi:hypothetical protein JZU69_05480, partial [bacterium]|nr:hypothetical protein [bacterium]
PKESFGEPVRSASAPSEIEELLRKIREAEAEGRSSDELRKQLMEAVNAFRRNAIVQQNARRPMPLPYQPRSIVITAKRGKPGAEKAQVVVGAQTARPSAASKPGSKAGVAKPGSKAGTGSITVTPGKPRVTPGQIAELMRQIRLTEAQGQPAVELRRQLYEAVELMKQQ